MPRVTKAELTAALESSESREKFLEYDNKAWKAEVARLKDENEALKAERGQHARSRSPRRNTMSAAATHRVLNLVQHFERDAVIDEQRETIAKQQREIKSLRRGDGPIGEVLLHNCPIDRLSQKVVLRQFLSKTAPGNKNRQVNF